MKRTEKCIYCTASFNPAKGAGDHILPVQLGEFKNDVRFRRICASCNNNIGSSEQQLLLCGPESFFRDLVKPKVPKRRKRGRSQVAAIGAPPPQSTSEFQLLMKETWPKSEPHNLPDTEAGITQVNGCVTFKVTDHYFRSLAKIAFHYYLVHSRRGFRGDEQCFSPIRDFIMNGGDDKGFFKQPGPKFAMPFGEIPSGGVITPKQWSHIIAADETDKVATVYIQLFVGPGCVPKPHYIKLADINSNVIIPSSTWSHVYLYDESQKSGRYAGEVKEAQITRIR